MSSILLYISACILAILVLLIQYNHLLITLLALEGIMLSLVLYVPIIIIFSRVPLAFLSLIILTLGACEAALGLSLLVLIARSYGNDLIKSLSINKC